MNAKKITYLDHAATTPVHPDVLSEMMPYFIEQFANPSTLYGFGRDARVAVDKAREQVAALLNADPREVYFTSGATESDNWAIMSTAEATATKGKHLITLPIEHHAVLGTMEHLKRTMGYDLTLAPVDDEGLVDPEAVRAAITDQTVFISIMHSNNEIGVIEPIAEIGAIAREKGVVFHTDATQSVGKVPIDVQALKVDMLSLSGHKLYGPKGIGALYVRKGVKIPPYLHGGAQESSRRAGTHNVPGIIGLGKACEIAGAAMSVESARLKGMRDRLIDGIMEAIPDVRLNGSRDKRLPNNVNVSIAGIEGESMILMLDFHGICVSSGSACTSGSLAASHVLLGINVPHDLAHGSLRLTLGKDNTDEDVNKVLEVLPPIVVRLREMSPMYGEGSCKLDFETE